MEYRGFYIDHSVPTVVDRWNPATRKVEPCVGYQCEVYDVRDRDRNDCLETFPLAVGHELKDISTENVERAIRNHIDEHAMYLDLMRNEVSVERRNFLIGILACRLGVNLEDGELYDLLSENIGMTDDEIRLCGLQRLAPFFDRETYAYTIAKYMIQRGTESTTTGNWHFGFDDLSERFGIDLKNDSQMVELIEQALWDQGEILSQIDIFDDDFDLMFYLNYCPFSDRDELEEPDEEQDAQRIGKETEMALKAQKITAEFPTPRYRALHYYLEKEGKSIESELRKHLEQMYREQVPKDVQEYVKAQNPDMEDPEQPAGNTKRQRVGQKHDTVVPTPDAPALKM
jgi:hypothetical protein